MIIDTIENLGKYVALNPLFADVIELISERWKRGNIRLRIKISF